jgi:hypothetical protein
LLELTGAARVAARLSMELESIVEPLVPRSISAFVENSRGDNVMLLRSWILGLAVLFTGLTQTPNTEACGGRWGGGGAYSYSGAGSMWNPMYSAGYGSYGMGYGGTGYSSAYSGYSMPVGYGVGMGYAGTGYGATGYNSAYSGFASPLGYGNGLGRLGYGNSYGMPGYGNSGWGYSPGYGGYGWGGMRR